MINGSIDAFEDGPKMCPTNGD